MLLDERYRPYTGQPARVENICGSFTERVETRNLQGVLVNTRNKFGCQREVFSLYGNVSIGRGRTTFMGARNAYCIGRLADALALSSHRNVVYMAVLCAKTGKRIQVRSSGLLEARLSNSWGHYLRVEARMYDHTNTVRMSIRHFMDPLAEGDDTHGRQETTFALAPAYRPLKNNWTITGRGTVMARFTWTGVEWTSECEAACLALCDRVVQRCLTFD